MAHKQFKTDLRWWICISLALFVVPWFLPISPYGANPFAFCVESFGDGSDSLIIISIYVLMLGIPAFVLGWILQCVVVMVKGAKNKEPEPKNPLQPQPARRGEP